MIQLNIFKPIFKKAIKSRLSNPQFEYRIIFREGAIQTIMRAKGWKNQSQMAAALGITKAYLTMLNHTKAQVTSNVITRVATITGNVNENWWIFYDIVPRGLPDPNHPVWNQEKAAGRIPYDKYSISAELRKQDYAVEQVGREVIKPCEKGRKKEI